jgi:uncharacterized MAPEG superfamily protein
VANRAAARAGDLAYRRAVKPELFYLLLTAMLTGSLWIPVVIGYVKTRGPIQPADYKVAPSSPLPAWVERANRAHINAIENLVPFVAVVMVALAAGVSNRVTVTCAAIYFFSRVLHAIVHVSGFAMFRARTVLFTIGWGAFIVYAVTVLLYASPK